MLGEGGILVWTVLAVVSSLLFLFRSFWIKLYIQCRVWRVVSRIKGNDLLQDGVLSYSTLNDTKQDRYDQLTFLCVNVRDNSCLHVTLTRKPGRKSYVMFTLDIDGQSYRLPGPVVTYNNPIRGFSSAGLTVSMLEEGCRWRLTYSGPVRMVEGDKVVDVKLMLLWKRHTRLINSSNFQFTKQCMTDFLFNCYNTNRLSLTGVNQAISNAMHPTCQSNIQIGLFQGYIHIANEEEKYLTLRGFKIHSIGQASRGLGSMPCEEHMMVSEKGYHQYLRVPYLSTGTIPDLSVLCCLKMSPNGEVAAAEVKCFHPQLKDEVETRSVLTTFDYTPDELTNYQLTDNRYGLKICSLYPFAFRHKHHGISQLDKGKGLLLLNNLIDMNDEGTTWQSLDHKSSSLYKPSVSRALLAAVDDEASASDVGLLVPLDDPICKNNQLVGGKGSQLAVLYQAQLRNECRVPFAMCFTVEAFHAQLHSNPQLLQLSTQLETEADTEKVKVLCEQLQQAIVTSEVNRQLSEALRCVLSSDGTRAPVFSEETRLAVRSSAIGEDGDDQSAAGQMDTILGVKGHADLLKAVLKCWASYFSFVAVQYKRQRGQPLNSGMAIVIQEMVKAEVAGALFTHDPVTNNCSTIVLNANFGVGESVVSGESEPDTIHISYLTDTSGHVTFSIRERHVGSKKVQYVVTDSGEIAKQTHAQSSQLCISDDLVLRLCRIGLELQEGFGHPCDVEWAINDKNIYLLQSRPITTLSLECEYELLHEFDSPLAMDHELLSTMNIGEVMPEPVCPLTLTTFLPRLQNGLQPFTSVNCPHSVEASLKTFCNKLFISVHSMEVPKGRRRLSNRRIIELALAGHTIDKMTDDEVKSYHPSVSWFNAVYNSVVFLHAIWSGVSRCLSHADALDRFTLPETTDCLQLMDHIEKALLVVQKVCLDDIPAAAQSGFFSQIVMVILTKGSEVWESKHLGDLAFLLGCRIINVLSAGVPEKLEELSVMIRDIPNLSNKFCEVTPSEGHDLLTESDTDTSIRDAYLSFMNDYGHRGVGELDVMQKSWSQEPSILVETLQLMVRNSSTEHHVTTPSHTDDVINSLQSDLNTIGKWVIRYLLPKTKVAINNREICKSLLVKSVYNLKLAFWRLSELMHLQGFLPAPELLFFLTHSEIYDVLKDRSSTLVTKAKRRMRLFDKQKAMKFPRFSDGMPIPLVKDEIEAEVEVQVTGMPVSVGEVTGVARVVTSLSQAHTIQKNEIMIVPYTDIGWAPFFPMIQGLVTEQGGLVSHGAVVAREYGIPCVASCSSATDIFHSGDTVCVNGKTGVVKRIKSNVE